MTQESFLLPTLLKALSIPLCIFLNAFFVAAEFALVAARRTRLQELANAGKGGAKAALASVKNLDTSIAATQLGITLASIALGWLGEPILAHAIDTGYQILFPSTLLSSIAVHSIATALAFTLISFLHVVFGELAPKALALQMPEQVALRLAWPLILFERLFRPFIWVLNGAGNAIVKILGLRSDPRSRVHSIEELKMLLEQTHEAGVLPQSQRDLVRRAFEFGPKKVKEVMIPYNKAIAIELRTPPEQLIELMTEAGHTRIPVYDENPDHVMGILHTKDLFNIAVHRELFHLIDLLRPPIYFEPNQSLEAAFREFQQTRTHMALVKERGKIVGLVTLEDLIEELFGEIEDEYDISRQKAALKKGKGRL
ncbi:MAG: HlyC/CorC family transporter [Deltaproteobacteria bacterium]|nr:HlyC/CorC family transporter [Deltaproteobacteria bacterium]